MFCCTKPGSAEIAAQESAKNKPLNHVIQISRRQSIMKENEASKHEKVAHQLRQKQPPRLPASEQFKCRNFLPVREKEDSSYLDPK